MFYSLTFDVKTTENTGVNYKGIFLLHYLYYN